MTFFILRDTRVCALIKTLITVRDVAGGTAHAPVVAPLIPFEHAHVTRYLVSRERSALSKTSSVASQNKLDVDTTG